MFQTFKSKNHFTINSAVDYIRSITLEIHNPYSINFSDSDFLAREIKQFDYSLGRDALLFGLMNSDHDDGKVLCYKYTGFCDICAKTVDFVVDSFWSTSSEGMICPSCNTSSRLRILYSAILENYKPGMNVYISEYVTPFFSIIKQKIPDIVGSEFLNETQLGLNPTVRHEDATSLTFNNECFDLHISNDVFEHVFDFKKAFSESFRILKPGGLLLFHVPFYYENITTKVRCRINPDGNVEHLVDPLYHGNPLSPDGSLCVSEFGWDIFEACKSSGFSNCYMVLVNDVRRGFISQTSNFIVAEKFF